MFRNILALGLSTGAKLIINAGLLIVLAKYLGVGSYGVLVTSIATTSLAVIVLDFGFATYIVKYVAERRNLVQSVMQNAIGLKVYLLLLYIAICIIVSLYFIEQENKVIFILITLVTFFDSQVNFLSIAFRAVSKFYLEARITLLSSLLHMIVIIPTAYFTGSLLYVGFAYLVVKIVTLIICYTAYFNEFGHIELPDKQILYFENMMVEFKKVKYYGFDSAIVNFRANIDTVIIKSLLGYESAGIYQAGVNIIKALERIGPIIANVYLPKMAKLDDNFPKYFFQLICLLLTISGSISLLLLILDFEAILGTEYEILNSLMKYLMIYFVVRYMCMGLGVFLTAINEQKLRVKFGLLNLFFAIASYYVLIPIFGLYGAVYAMILISLMLLFCFGYIAFRNKKYFIGIKK